MSLDLMLFLRRAPRDGSGREMFFRHSPPTPGTLRFGVLFADGRRATNLDKLDWSPSQRRADSRQPVLWPCGGGGGQFFYHTEVYVYPLPPESPLTLVVEWPEQQVPETRTEWDATVIRATAARAREIWPDLPPAIDRGEAGSQFTVT